MNAAIYRVNSTEFTSFKAAVDFARSIDAEVFQIDNGLRRWAPASKPSPRRVRQYLEQKAAYEAQQRASKGE